MNRHASTSVFQNISERDDEVDFSGDDVMRTDVGEAGNFVAVDVV